MLFTRGEPPPYPPWVIGKPVPKWRPSDISDSETGRDWEQAGGDSNQDGVDWYRVHPEWQRRYGNASPPREPEVIELEDACLSGDFPLAQKIVQDFHEKMRDQPTGVPFEGAFKYTMHPDRVHIAAWLVAQGYQINSAHFHHAIKEKCYPFMQLALDHGFDINEPEGDWRPAPIVHAFHDRTMTEWFLDHGADPNALTRLRWTPISTAVMSASFDIITLLFDRGGPESIYHGLLLHRLVDRQIPDYLAVLEYLFSKGAKDQLNNLMYHDCTQLAWERDTIIGCDTPLHAACRDGRLDIVKVFLANGADPTIRSAPTMLDSQGQLPIDKARKGGHTDVVELLATFSGWPS